MRGGLGVWRALDEARALNLEAAGEEPARGGPDGLSRRRLVAALGAGLGAAAAPALAAAPVPRVVVVGGGLAGLSALWRLRSRGVEAVLYEARPVVGGRTRRSTGLFAPGYAVDEGGQLVNTDHADMRRLARQLGLTLIDRKGRQKHEELQLGADGGARAEAPLAEGLRDIAARITADSDRLDKDKLTVSAEIDQLSVTQYLDRHGLAPGDARDAIEAGMRTEYGAEPGDCSALELLFNLPTVSGRRLTRLSLSDERYLVDGGAARVAETMGARLRSRIRLGQRLQRLEVRGDHVQLAFSGGEQVVADRVILALPAPLLREVEIDGELPHLWRELIGVVQLGSNEKLVVGYDRQPWRAAMGPGGSLWSVQGFAEAWDAASSRAAAGPGAMAYLLGGAQVQAAEATDSVALAEQFTAAARAAILRMPSPNGRLRRTAWTRDPLSRGAYINFRPGQLTRFGALLTTEEKGGAARASRAGPVLFAGEWLSDAFPGYMNGAAQTGRIAADAALA